MSDTVSHRFVLLNHTNYAQWSMRMEAELVRKDFWGLITGDETTPKKPEDVPAFRKRQAACRAEIILRADDSQLSHMRDNDPKIVWEELAKVHRARGFGTRLSLRRGFLTASMREDQTMQAWVGEVRSLAYRLKDIGVRVDDEEIIVVLTIGLPPAYKTLVISLDSVDTDKLTLEFVITRLLNEEAQQLGQPEQTVLKAEPKEEGGGLALAAHSRHEAGTLKVTCFYCMKRGHYAADCPVKKADIEEREDKNRKAIGSRWGNVHVATTASCDGSDSDDDEVNYVL
jgi:hypothetical protein